MKKILFYILLAFSCSSVMNYSETRKSKIVQSENIILWSNDRRLIWDDFRGSSRAGATNKVAETNSIISVSYKYSQKRITHYTVVATFNREQSWTISNKKDVLDHEQLHFDITELYARKIRKSFDELIQKKSTVTAYSKVYSFYIKEWKKEQNLYDSQVYGNKLQQEKWFRKIAFELQQLDKYNS